MLAVILSGGLGTRLHPLTIETPKPMLSIANKPHLEYIIALLKKHGYKDIIFSTGYLHNQITGHFGKTTRDTLSKFGVIIRYKEDGEQLLGTAGALRNCLDLIDAEKVLVMNGDILTNIDLTRLTEIHNQKRQPITMSVLEVADATGFGLTPYDSRSGKVLGFYEKPDKPTAGPINTGIYIMQREVIKGVKDGFSMLETDVFPQFASAGMIQGMVSIEGAGCEWIDIGTHERYAKAQAIGESLKTFF